MNESRTKSLPTSNSVRIILYTHKHMLSFSQCRFAINHCLNELFGEFSSSSCSTFTDKRSHKSEKGLLFLYSLVFVFFGWVLMMIMKRIKCLCLFYEIFMIQHERSFFVCVIWRIFKSETSWKEGNMEKQKGNEFMMFGERFSLGIKFFGYWKSELIDIWRIFLW